jgi:hypothetical protein
MMGDEKDRGRGIDFQVHEGQKTSDLEAKNNFILAEA